MSQRLLLLGTPVPRGLGGAAARFLHYHLPAAGENRHADCKSTSKQRPAPVSYPSTEPSRAPRSQRHRRPRPPPAPSSRRPRSPAPGSSRCPRSPRFTSARPGRSPSPLCHRPGRAPVAKQRVNNRRAAGWGSAGGTPQAAKWTARGPRAGARETGGTLRCATAVGRNQLKRARVSVCLCVCACVHTGKANSHVRQRENARTTLPREPRSARAVRCRLHFLLWPLASGGCPGSERSSSGLGSVRAPPPLSSSPGRHDRWVSAHPCREPGCWSALSWPHRCRCGRCRLHGDAVCCLLAAVSALVGGRPLSAVRERSGHGVTASRRGQAGCPALFQPSAEGGPVTARSGPAARVVFN